MQIPAWQIATWAEVSVSVHDWDTYATAFRHLGTTAYQYDDETGLRRGQALWAREAANDIVGLAWDWAELRPGVVAMSDPMTVLSNVLLVDEQGCPLDAFRRILCLNNSVFLLPWQQRTREIPQAIEPMAA